MPGQTSDLVKEKLDIADVVRAYVALSPAGKNLKGLCPFHKEKSPSFMVNPERQIWHCFGCGLGGDMFGFVMRYENIDFIEALKILADKAGVDMKVSSSRDERQYNVLYEINKAAKNYFVAALAAEASKPVREYVASRGLSQKTVEEFEIGFAPPSNDSLLRFLTTKGFAVSDIERAGVAFKTDRGTYWDRFRNRVMFPLHNASGKVIGFTGRVLPGHENENTGKYVNSPETPIFSKSKLLFGFWKTKGAIRETNTAVLVEGQMDFLMSYQDGITNAVATSGTALTEEHLRTLRRLCENLVLAFDNDGAGRAAAERTIDAAAAFDFNVRVLPLTDPSAGSGQAAPKDPADIVKAESGKMAKLVAAAMPAMEYYFQYHQVSKDQPLTEKKRAIRAVLSKIKTISSPVEQSHWLAQLGDRSGTSEQVLAAEMRQLKIEGGKLKTDEVKPEESAVAAAKLDLILQRLLALTLATPALLPHLEKHFALMPGEYQEAFEYIKKPFAAPKTGPIAELLDLIHLRSGLEVSDPEKVEHEFKDLIIALQGEYLKARRKQLQDELKEAERAKDEPRVAKLLAEYKELTKKS